MVPSTALPALMAAGGLDPDELANGTPAAVVPKYNGLLDARGVEQLGAELARRLADHGPELVLVWQDVEDVLLAHIVARELGVGVVRAYDADGRVAYTGTFPAAARVAIVTDLVRDDTAVRALRQLVAQQSGEVVGIGTLVATSPAAPPDTPPLVALVSPAGPR